MRPAGLIVIGAVVWLSALPSAFSAGSDLRGEIKVGNSYRPTDLVVYLADPAFTPASQPSTTVVMDQRNQTYSPHVLAVLKGTTVKFTNSDRVTHNVFSLSSAKRFDVGKIAPGSYGTVTFDKAGTVEILCGFHSRMLAYIWVMEHPYFAIPDSQGRFVIKSVPAGSYQLRVWHESGGEINAGVRVTGVESAPVRIQFPN